jgi:hypothetical protein
MATELTLNSVVKMILVLVIAILLIMAFINPITKVYKSFTSLGKSESNELYLEKQACTEKIDSGKDINDCALVVAGLSLKEEAPIVAESWLRKQIELTNDQTLLGDCFIFARDELYPESKDWAGAMETYDLLYAKLRQISPGDVILDQIIFEKTFANIYLITNEKETTLTVEKYSLLKSLSNQAMELYAKNKYEDKYILSSCSWSKPVIHTESLPGAPNIKEYSTTICGELRNSLKYACFSSEKGCVSCSGINSCENYDKTSCVYDPCKITGCHQTESGCSSLAQKKSDEPSSTANPTPTPAAPTPTPVIP